MQRFAGKVALVTGAGSGIGAAAATRLAAEGATVVLSGRRQAPLDDLVRRISADGGRAVARVADMTGEDDVRDLVDFCVQEHGGLHAAFNNAGSVSAIGAVASLDLDAWRADVDSNLTSVFLCLKHQAAQIEDGGAILNNASIAAVRGTPSMSAYTAAKHGVLGLTRSVALELVGRGVRVNALVTGNVDTPLYRSLVGVDDSADLPPAPNPTGRAATAEEVAAFVAFALSDEAAFVTGAALTIDGGYTAG